MSILDDGSDWCFLVFFFKQKTAYEMRISDWSSDVCSSDLGWSTGFLATPRVSGRLPSQRLRPALPRLVFWLSGFDTEPTVPIDRKSVGLGKSVSVRVDLGGGSISQKRNSRMTHKIVSSHGIQHHNHNLSNNLSIIKK